MTLLTHPESLLQAAEMAAFAPVLLALTLITLPIILPLAIYRGLHGAPLQDEE